MLRISSICEGSREVTTIMTQGKKQGNELGTCGGQSSLSPCFHMLRISSICEGSREVTTIMTQGKKQGNELGTV